MGDFKEKLKDFGIEEEEESAGGEEEVEEISEIETEKPKIGENLSKLTFPSYPIFEDPRAADLADWETRY